jgi:hypothetical protein
VNVRYRFIEIAGAAEQCIETAAEAFGFFRDHVFPGLLMRSFPHFNLLGTKYRFA